MAIDHGDQWLRAAIDSGGITQPDERGLMPLREARAWLAGIETYAKGEQIAIVDGHVVLEADRSWAALMSLSGSAEFLAQTRRLRWAFEVRGMDNIAPLQRYGDAVLEWIADRVDSDGTLHNTPWCLLPCLLACGSPDALAVAVRIRGVVGTSATEHQHSVAARWVLRHPHLGYRLIATLPAGESIVEELWALDPRGTRQALVAAVGADPVDELSRRLSLTVPPLAEQIDAVLAGAPSLPLGPSRPVSIAELDEAFESVEVPLYDNANYFCAAIRLTGFVVPGGQDGLVFQYVMTGLGQDAVVLEFAAYGFGAAPGIRWGQQRVLLDDDAARDVRPASVCRLNLPSGPAEIQPRRELSFGDQFGPLETVMLAITEDRPWRDRTFLRPDQLVDHLALPPAAEALFTVDNWDHPAAVEPASSSVDLVLAVEALRQRRAITRTVTERSRESLLTQRIDILEGWGDTGAWRSP